MPAANLPCTELIPAALSRALFATREMSFGVWSTMRQCRSTGLTLASRSSMQSSLPHQTQNISFRNRAVSTHMWRSLFVSGRSLTPKLCSSTSTPRKAVAFMVQAQAATAARLKSLEVRLLTSPFTIASPFTSEATLCRTCKSPAATLPSYLVTHRPRIG